MYPFRRNPIPRRLTWELTDAVVSHFFWLGIPHPGKGQGIDARVRGNGVEVLTRNVKQFTLGLDGRLVDFGKPVRVTLDGKAQTLTLRPSLRTRCQSMAERGDPQLAFTCQVSLTPEKKQVPREGSPKRQRGILLGPSLARPSSFRRAALPQEEAAAPARVVAGRG
jgi:hypothetical protein